jgi:hypothetical protein
MRQNLKRRNHKNLMCPGLTTYWVTLSTDTVLNTTLCTSDAFTNIVVNYVLVVYGLIPEAVFVHFWFCVYTSINDIYYVGGAFNVHLSRDSHLRVNWQSINNNNYNYKLRQNYSYEN